MPPFILLRRSRSPSRRYRRTVRVIPLNPTAAGWMSSSETEPVGCAPACQLGRGSPWSEPPPGPGPSIHQPVVGPLLICCMLHSSTRGWADTCSVFKLCLVHMSRRFLSCARVEVGAKTLTLATYAKNH